MNKFIPFLAMDYQTDPNPMPKDKEGNNRHIKKHNYKKLRIYYNYK